MSANLLILALVAILISTGVYLLIERAVTRMLLGFVLIGNGINLLIITTAGRDGLPPIFGLGDGEMADPLAQAMVLTAIVITMGLSAFVLALIYRAYRLSAADTVEDDPEDVQVGRRLAPGDQPDADRSDDPLTGEPSIAGDAQGNPIPLEQLRGLTLEDVEGYDDLHLGHFEDPHADDGAEFEQLDAEDRERNPREDR